MLGRKKKDSKEIGKHTKFDDDNIIRKIKPLFKLELLYRVVDTIINIYYSV